VFIAVLFSAKALHDSTHCGFAGRSFQVDGEPAATVRRGGDARDLRWCHEVLDSPDSPSQRATSHLDVRNVGTGSRCLLRTGHKCAGATQSASLAGVTATFTYRARTRGAAPRLTITRSGAVLYDELVHSVWSARVLAQHHFGESEGRPRSATESSRATGGRTGPLQRRSALLLHRAGVFFGATSRTVLKTERNFGDPGVKMDSIGADGAVDFVSANDAFAYAFTDYAASGVPIQIFSFSHHYFRDVTRSFPSLIAKDAAQWRRAFDAQAATHYQDSVGVIAAWAADEDMLGHGAVVSTFLAGQARAGHLNSALSPIEPSGRRFVIALQPFFESTATASRSLTSSMITPGVESLFCEKFLFGLVEGFNLSAGTWATLGPSDRWRRR